MHGVFNNNQLGGMHKILLNNNRPQGGAHNLPLLNNKLLAGDKILLNRPQGGAHKTQLHNNLPLLNNKLLAGDKILLNNNQPREQQAAGWGTQNPTPQQPAAWGAPGSGSVGGQQQWDAPSSPDPWAQPQQGASPWGQQGNQSPAPTTYGSGGGSGQSWAQPAQVADQWGQPVQQAQQGAWAPGVQQPPPSTPPGGNVPWQQQGQGQAQQDFGASPLESPDGDRTMLRSTGGTQGSGFVRIEEGKEPGRVYEVSKESLSIGRSRESDIFLEDLAVSRLHASIISQGNNNYALRDEGSANGTKVNGQPVNKYQPYPLQEGDKIQLGQTVLVFARR